MDDRNAQVGWTEAQWNRVRQEVLRAWQSARVAGTFLPVYGPLPPSTLIVPSEIWSDGKVDDRATASVLEISLTVELTRQQAMEDDLSSALLEFRRRATQIAQLEDWYIFNGQYPPDGPPPGLTVQSDPSRPSFCPTVAYAKSTSVLGIEPPIGELDWTVQKDLLRRRNPGALGLLEGAALLEAEPASKTRSVGMSDGDLTEAIVTAITSSRGADMWRLMCVYLVVSRLWRQMIRSRVERFPATGSSR